LAEKGIPYEPIDVHADKKVKASEEFRKASPKGTVPAIIDGDVYLSEAYKINEYLEDKCPAPPLLPKDATQRAKIREWVAVYDKRLVLKIGLLLIECILKPKDQQKEETKTTLRTEIFAALKEVEDVLKGKEYIFGNYSLADVSLTPHLVVLPRLGVELGEGYSNILGWIERIKARPNFAATVC